ncbi:flagellar hook-basal body complex protein FliE [Escherichia coli]|uniref:flagellar hook-basal body complex protein FliE n=1 Tax=Escherichia coli TaxID=562 RepID=UPI00063D0F29|nr:flagellar hook-basal body complex protein FliE [Escherichia coli]EEZ6414185.1 flagellar hook-basal body complex protein FliE [Escherichia coli O104]EFA5043782.1 flagellar hook-basal body protein FliE [Escherichia coli]EFC5408092.1 flagellar hook-basal body complex protein FliE [Escherichia coli]EFH8735054.1 flagellar hook-basal body protein FliE [Escherichia coli]EFI2836821.1 flagellar hook-basal body complex protein FliE [Escherichia coli]
MSITTINSTMQAQIMQDVQLMQANAQAPVLPAMTFSSTDPDVSFHRIMQGALGHVDQFQQVAEQQQTAIDMGKSDDLAGAMIASQQASLSFSALVQVRNKIATGFNDLMSMSI